MAGEETRCILVGVNRADAGTMSASSAALPAANLQDRQITKVWRSTATVAWVQCDFGQARWIELVALIGLAITQLGTWRIRLSDDPTFATAAYDSGAVRAWPIIGGHGALPWGVWSWGDLLGEEDAAYYTITALQLLPEAVVARYLRIDIDDTGNPDGFVQAGRLIAGPAYRPSYNLDYGWEIGFVDESGIDRSRGGQTWVDERPRYRVARFTLSGISEAELYANVFDYVDRRKGIAGDVLWIPQPHKPELYVHEVIYGHMRSLSPITNPAPGPSTMRSRAFEIEELL